MGALKNYKIMKWNILLYIYIYIYIVLTSKRKGCNTRTSIAQAHRSLRIIYGHVNESF